MFLRKYVPLPIVKTNFPLMFLGGFLILNPLNLLAQQCSNDPGCPCQPNLGCVNGGFEDSCINRGGINLTLSQDDRAEEDECKVNLKVTVDFTIQCPVNGGEILRAMSRAYGNLHEKQNEDADEDDLGRFRLGPAPNGRKYIGPWVAGWGRLRNHSSASENVAVFESCNEEGNACNPLLIDDEWKKKEKFYVEVDLRKPYEGGGLNNTGADREDLCDLLPSDVDACKCDPTSSSSSSSSPSSSYSPSSTASSSPSPSRSPSHSTSPNSSPSNSSSRSSSSSNSSSPSESPSYTSSSSPSPSSSPPPTSTPPACVEPEPSPCRTWEVWDEEFCRCRCRSYLIEDESDPLFWRDCEKEHCGLPFIDEPHPENPDEIVSYCCRYILNAHDFVCTAKHCKDGNCFREEQDFRPAGQLSLNESECSDGFGLSPNETCNRKRSPFPGLSVNDPWPYCNYQESEPSDFARWAQSSNAGFCTPLEDETFSIDPEDPKIETMIQQFSIRNELEPIGPTIIRRGKGFLNWLVTPPVKTTVYFGGVGLMESLEPYIKSFAPDTKIGLRSRNEIIEIGSNKVELFVPRKPISTDSILIYKIDNSQKGVSLPVHETSNNRISFNISQIGFYQMFVSAKINQMEFGEVFVYPNPSKPGDPLKISIQIGLADSLLVRIYDIAGNLIYNSRVFEIPIIEGEMLFYEHQLSHSHFKSGTYFGVITAQKLNQKTQRKKFKFSIVK